MARSLLLDVMSTRLKAMGPELLWALGAPQDDDFVTPPDWIKNLLLMEWQKATDGPEKSAPNTSHTIATLIGLGTGMADAARVFLAEEKEKIEANPLELTQGREFLERLSGPINSQIDNMAGLVTKFPNRAYKSKVADLAALSAAHSLGTAAVADAASEDSDSTITDELKFLFWIFWREIATATSVQKVHHWISSMGFIQCSPKLVEKLCREIGFRGSSRGRKKRIPTKRKKQ
jgi:hypothetical protein